MVPPFIDEISPMFHLQINGEVVYKWRDVYGRPRTVCDLLQASILPLGYEMTESVRERVGKTTAESIRRFWRKMQSTKDGKKRKRIKAETWIKLAIRLACSRRSDCGARAKTKASERAGKNEGRLGERTPLVFFPRSFARLIFRLRSTI